MKSPLGLVPPIWLLFAVIIMIALNVYLPIARLIDMPWRLVGFVPMGLCFLVVFVATRQFRRNGTAVIPFKRSTTLVTDGVFAYSRNPMYLSMMLLLVSVGVLLGSAMPFVVVIPFWVLLEFGFIRREERLLVERFSQPYRAYCECVRRWI